MRKLIAASFIAAALASNALAQGFTIPPNTVWNGHQLSGGNIPTVAGCGSPAIQGASTDVMGRFTTGATSGCVLTFAVPWVQPPVCFVQDVTTNADSGGFTVSTTAITFGTVVNGDTIQWFCLGRSSG